PPTAPSPLHPCPFTPAPTPELYPLSLHDALPTLAILDLPQGDDPPRFNLAFPGSACPHCHAPIRAWQNIPVLSFVIQRGRCAARSEEHTSELQSRFDLVCRLLLEKKKRRIRLK